MDEAVVSNGRQIEPNGENDQAASITAAQAVIEIVLLMLVFFVYAGDLPPMVNEAHYFAKAKNFWQPDWCRNDLFIASGNAHTAYYVLFGWPTQFFSFETTAWLGRLVGWCMLAIGLHRLCWNLLRRRYVSLAVAVIWIAGIEYGNLAGEWVVGGIEAKVPAYGLILLALSEMVMRRWSRVWILLGAASAFHVLSGGWSVVAAACSWWFTERGRDDARPLFTPALFIGGAIALMGLVPAIALSAGASAEDSLIAARIYSYRRISHHLLPGDFKLHWYVRHGVLLLGTLLLAFHFRRDSPRLARMNYFVFGAILIAACGMLVGLLPYKTPDLAAKLLRFYWFRLSDAAVPLLFALLVARSFYGPLQPLRYAGIALLACAILLDLQSSYQRSRLGVPPSASNDVLGLGAGAEPAVQQQVFRDWMAVCRWARASSDPDAVFLTPRHQQSFKWYAERAEVVNWKDVPQDATNLREWYRRFQEVYPQRLGSVRVTIQYSQLRKYREKYGVEFLIVDRRLAGNGNLPLVRVYPTGDETNQTYAVYELPR